MRNPSNRPRPEWTISPGEQKGVWIGRLAAHTFSIRWIKSVGRSQLVAIWEARHITKKGKPDFRRNPILTEHKTVELAPDFDPTRPDSTWPLLLRDYGNRLIEIADRYETQSSTLTPKGMT